MSGSLAADRRDAEPSPRARIAHVVLSLEPGGLERIVCDLAGHALQHDHDAIVCCLDERGALAHEVEHAGGRVLLVKRKPGADPLLIRRLAGVFVREGVTAVHTHSLDPMFYGGMAARLAGVGCVVHTQHDVMIRDYGRAERLKFRLASPCFTQIVGVSAETTRLLQQAGVPGARSATVLNGVDLERFRHDRQTIDWSVTADWPHDPRAFVVGTVARLSPEKGLDRLIAAFEALFQQVPAARLVIVGDGPERERLLQRMRTSALPEGTIRFLGRQQRVEHILPRFDVFALSSLTEGIPVAALEAMAAARPVVATRVGGVPEVVADGESGILVSPDDPAQLAGALLRLAADPIGRRRMGEAGQTLATERFGLAAMATAYESMYRTAESLSRRLVKQHVLRRFPPALLAWAGHGRTPEIALTFDDGPHPGYTPQILDILRHKGIRSTFFLVGERAEREPDLVRRILEDGHELANHSWTHPDFDEIGWTRALDEIGRTKAALERSSAQRCGLFRPPKGKLCLASIFGSWLKRSTLVMWSVDLKDYEAASAAQILAPLRGRPLTAGDIVLYHGHSPAAVAALPAVIEHAVARRLRCVPVSRVLRAPV
jgi:glycosyltransferase involved in cell wall biosynthesis/peptidoglycan/xylan/chitin deacetylase (PgdA/CDA1 family)